MNRPRAVFLMVLCLTATSCLSAAVTLIPRQVKSFPSTGHRWTSPTIFRPAANVLPRATFQPQTTRLDAEILRIVSPVRRHSAAPVFAPGRSASLPGFKIERSTTR